MGWLVEVKNSFGICSFKYHWFEGTVKRDTIEDIKDSLGDVLGISDEKTLMEELEGLEIDVSFILPSNITECHWKVQILTFRGPSTVYKTATVWMWSSTATKILTNFMEHVK